MSFSLGGMFVVLMAIAVIMSIGTSRFNVKFMGNQPNSVFQKGEIITFFENRFDNNANKFNCEFVRYAELNSFVVKIRFVDWLRFSAYHEYSIMGPELTYYPTVHMTRNRRKSKQPQKNDGEVQE